MSKYDEIATPQYREMVEAVRSLQNEKPDGPVMYPTLMTPRAEDLKPCPFCGGEVEIIEGDESAYVQCHRVKMHRALWFDGDNNAAEEVREQWNRRDHPSNPISA